MARYELQGKVALVTGGARGIGLATARGLHARGASVAIVDLRREAAEEAAAGIDATRALGLEADVSDAEAVEEAVEATVERFGGLDVVVANAGIATRATTALAMDPDAFERVLDVNLLGVWRTVRAALPHVVARRRMRSRRRASSSSGAPCARSSSSTARARASRISASSTPSWSTRPSTRTRSPSG